MKNMNESFAKHARNESGPSVGGMKGGRVEEEVGGKRGKCKKKKKKKEKEKGRRTKKKRKRTKRRKESWSRVRRGQKEDLYGSLSL